MAQASLKNLKAGSHIHLMGICGTAMASLAGLLKDRGYKVTGSDLQPYPPMSTQIESMGISIMKPYSAQNLHPQPDFVIVGNVISANNEEAIELNKLNLPYCSLPQAMGEVIIDDRQSFVISGTHGKTTTTSLMAWVFEVAGLQPGFLIGGIPKNFAQSFKNPARDIFVIEGDEYDTAYFDKVPKFVHYKPLNVTLTSVEFDHADIYADFQAVKNAFLKLVSLVPKNGRIVYWGDDENVKAIAKTSQAAPIYSYGFKSGQDFKCEILQEGLLTKFNIKFEAELLKNHSTFKGKTGVQTLEFKIPLPGRFNILNATAVITQALLQNIEIALIQKALETFEGVKRRQEVLGEPRGILIVEDFAHHPTAVKETVLAIQNKYAPRKVFSVFEPRSATSRRKVFQKDYVEAFSLCHEVIIAEAFDQGKISEDNRFSSQELVQDLKNLGHKAHVMSQVDDIVAYLKAEARPQDVILIMSNGGFGGIYQKLFKALE